MRQKIVGEAVRVFERIKKEKSYKYIKKETIQRIYHDVVILECGHRVLKGNKTAKKTLIVYLANTVGILVYIVVIN